MYTGCVSPRDTIAKRGDSTCKKKSEGVTFFFFFIFRLRLRFREDGIWKFVFLFSSRLARND